MAQGFILSGSNLAQIDTANLSTPNTFSVTGITSGETLVGIDFRPQNGVLYGLGVNAGVDTATLYAISIQTGVATAVGTAGGITGAGDLPADGYSFDFNPIADRIRVTTNSGLNFRVNPNTGTLAAADTAINGGGSTGVSGAAYTNNTPDATTTTLYTLDANSDSLLVQSPPNDGTQTLVGALGIAFDSASGFDISANTNSAFAILNIGGARNLYSVNLGTGQATLVGLVTGAPVQGLAFQNDVGIPAIALAANGTDLIRFNTASIGPTSTTQPITTTLLTNAGEELAGIDFRPQTGQLYGLGVDEANNNASLYIVDPENGTLTRVGAEGAIAFVDAMTNAVSLPAPSTGYGFDFNPTVDRIRVTTSTGLNFRVNPSNGAPVDGDTVTGGVNTDAGINGNSVAGVSATAYTNSYGQTVPPAMGGSTRTTLYTLDDATDQLLIQNPANGGTQTSPLPVTLSGTGLDFDDVNGFDISSGVRAASANAPASGLGYAGLESGGTTSVYSVNLATGAATLLGTVAAGIRGLALAASDLAPSTPTDSDAATNATQVGAATGSAVGVTVSATDPEAQAVTYVLINNAGGAFTINSTTGVVTVANSGALVAGTVNITAQAGDGFLTSQQTFAIDVAVAPDTGGGGGGGGGGVSTTPSESGDSLTGSSANDTVRGGGGNDTMDGGAGNDLLSGNLGNDIVGGGAGNDTVFGGQGSDTLKGAEDNDLLFGNLGDDAVSGNAGSDTVSGGQGNDTIYGGQGSDRMFGGQGNDTVFGNLGDDLIAGNLGDDLVNGGQGNDTLYGGQGSDTIVGGTGNDLLFGNLGADRFVFGAASGADRVTGFSQGDGDRLDLMGQTYTTSTGADGSAVLTLSGGGIVTLTGVAPGAVNAGFFA